MIAPLVYMNMYCSMTEAVYMTMVNNIYLGMGAMVVTMAVVVPFQFCLMYPIEQMFFLSLGKLHKST
jgi:hypothetical protein